MRSQIIWHLASLNCMFIMAEIVIWCIMFTKAASSDHVLNKVTPTTDYQSSPPKIAAHASTYFDKVKPIFNDFTHYGIHMKLPIGESVTHAKLALHFVNAIPFDRLNMSDIKDVTSVSDNNLSTTTIPHEKM